MAGDLAGLTDPPTRVPIGTPRLEPVRKPRLRGVWCADSRRIGRLGWLQDFLRSVLTFIASML